MWLVVATAVAIAALSTVEAVDFSSQATVGAPLTVDYALRHWARPHPRARRSAAETITASAIPCPLKRR